MDNTSFIGIDLGTSRIAISASNGFRDSVLSYVGYPKDHVARKHLGKDILFGRKAFEHRMSVNLIRPLGGSSIKKSGAKDSDEVKKATRELLKHVVSLADIPKTDTICAVIGAPARINMEGQSSIIEACKDFVDHIMICSEPFAVAYGLDFLDDTLIVDVGAGTVDLCRVHGTMPSDEDQTNHLHGGDRIDEILLELIQKSHPEVQLTQSAARDLKEKYSSVSENMDPILVKLRVNGQPQEFDITEEMRNACRSLIEPTASCLQKLIATYDSDFQEKMLNHILIGGGGSQINGLDRALEKGLEKFGGGKATQVEDAIYAGSNGALKIAFDMGEENWNKFKTSAMGAK